MALTDKPSIIITGVVVMLLGIGLAVVKSNWRPRLAALACVVYGLYLALLGSGVVS